MSPSAGVRALHVLHDSLRERGYEAYIFSSTFYYSLRKTPPKYRYAEPLSEFSVENDIVVYPEVVRGNPLRFQNVVRYVLYFPGVLGGAKEYHHSEKIFTWDTMYFDAQKLVLPIIDTELFFDAALPKTQDCYFIHKGKKWKDIRETDGLLEINMRFPKNRSELARLLQTTRILYSYDKFSALNTEALLCGAQVKIITENGFEDHICKPFDMENFARELEFFIRETQQMHYTGEIEQEYFCPRSLCNKLKECTKKISLPYYQYAVRRKLGGSRAKTL